MYNQPMEGGGRLFIVILLFLLLLNGCDERADCLYRELAKQPESLNIK
jgi:hypothetical protein